MYPRTHQRSARAPGVPEKEGNFAILIICMLLCSWKLSMGPLPHINNTNQDTKLETIYIFLYFILYLRVIEQIYVYKNNSKCFIIIWAIMLKYVFFTYHQIYATKISRQKDLITEQIYV